MTQELKQKSTSKAMSLLKFGFGVSVLILGSLLSVRYFHLMCLVGKALVGPFLILAGLIIIAIAKE